MRSHLSNIVEKFKPILERYDGFTEPQVELILALLSDAFKSGFSVGAAKTGKLVLLEIDKVRNNIALVAKVLGGDADNPTVQGAWSSCDALQVGLAGVIEDLSKDYLH